MGGRFDRAYSNAQLAIQTEAVDQFGASRRTAPVPRLRRYAQMMLPKSKMFLEYASAWPQPLEARSARLESASGKVVL